MSEKEVLLMLSGGRDSLLCACRLVRDGYFVRMITFDNGCSSGIDNVSHTAKRIIERFGKGKVAFEGTYRTAQDLSLFMDTFHYTELQELSRNYPCLVSYQVDCLACHTAMYAHAIAYCNANDLSVLAEGGRRQQKFFVELDEMKQRYTDLCKKHGIELIYPVYELESDMDRKTEISRYGFLPKVYECQCWLGRKMHNELTNDQRRDLTAFFDNEICPKVDGLIRDLTDIKGIRPC